MKLAYKKTGTGSPIIIVHGLFGSSDNWQSQARRLAEKHTVYAIDLRNHGHSPHADTMSFDEMAADLMELVADEALYDIILMGHSLGGKVVMVFTRNYPGSVAKLIVADMGIKAYPPQHEPIFEALRQAEVAQRASRQEVKDRLSSSIHDTATLQFLMKSLYWKSPGQLAWRFNLDILYRQRIHLLEELYFDQKINAPALFIRGEKSGYIKDEDIPHIRHAFSHITFATIPDAGHWLHAENPTVFIETVQRFIAYSQ